MLALLGSEMNAVTRFLFSDHSSPMSVYQQPASMPAYHLPPHTPLQHQKSFTGGMAQSTNALPTAAASAGNYSGSANPSDPFYNAAPHSVPTPSKMSSNSLISNSQAHTIDEKDSLTSTTLQETSKLPPPLTSATRPPSQPSIPRQPNAPPRLSASNQAQQQRTLTKQTSMIQPASQKAATKPGANSALVPVNTAASKSGVGIKPMSKLAQYVLHIPVPQTQRFQHERNQRFVVLYGFGAKK